MTSPASNTASTRLIRNNEIRLNLSGEEDNERYGFFKSKVIEMRRNNPWGREKITKLLQKEFGKDQSDPRGFIYGEKKVEKMYEGIPKGPVPVAMAFDRREYPNSEMPYLTRLDFLKKRMYPGERLTIAEADVAVRLQHYFESPDGDSVDLIPQLGVIEAYTRASEADLDLEPLNALLILQPWKPAGGSVYREALRSRELQFPMIPMLSEIADTATDVTTITPYIHGANAQLGLPAVVYFISDERKFSLWSLLSNNANDGDHKETNDSEFHSLRQTAGWCNWRRQAIPRTFQLKQPEGEKCDEQENTNGDR